MTHPANNLPSTHPGKFLLDELDTLALTTRASAKRICVPPDAVAGIMDRECLISVPMAIQLAERSAAAARQPAAKMQKTDTASQKPVPWWADG
jgi:plasmid maintenance system antidote protein VapI